MIMEYIVTTDKNELDLIEGGYYEIYPEMFKKVFWNENSVFISDALMHIIDDILKKSNVEYSSFWDFTYFSIEKVNKFENELQKRLNEIINNGYLKKGKNNKKYYDYINIHMELYKNEIIEMLDNFILWIKLNKSNGITVIGM